MSVRNQAKAIADQCRDAYSFERYSSWPASQQHGCDAGQRIRNRRNHAQQADALGRRYGGKALRSRNVHKEMAAQERWNQQNPEYA